MKPERNKIKYVIDSSEPDTITPHGFTSKAEALQEFVRLVAGYTTFSIDDLRAVFRDLEKDGIHMRHITKPDRDGYRTHTFSIQTGESYTHGGVMGYNCGDVLAINHEIVEP